jgi:tRNA U38,U39,U40 pseudouridine synthase TruA
VKEVLEAKNRGHSGVTAPPHGLTLIEVFYGQAPHPQGPNDSHHDE